MFEQLSPVEGLSVHDFITEIYYSFMILLQRYITYVIDRTMLNRFSI